MIIRSEYPVFQVVHFYFYEKIVIFDPAFYGLGIMPHNLVGEPVAPFIFMGNTKRVHPLGGSSKMLELIFSMPYIPAPNKLLCEGKL
jgi:hypothetical protein